MEEERKVLLKSIVENIVSMRETEKALREFSKKNGVEVSMPSNLLLVNEGLFELAEAVGKTPFNMGAGKEEIDGDIYYVEHYSFKYGGIRFAGKVVVGLAEDLEDGN